MIGIEKTHKNFKICLKFRMRGGLVKPCMNGFIAELLAHFMKHFLDVLIVYSLYKLTGKQKERKEKPKLALPVLLPAFILQLFHFLCKNTS